MASDMLGDNGVVSAGVPMLVMVDTVESPVDVSVMVIMLDHGEIVCTEYNGTKYHNHEIGITIIIL